MTVPTLAERQGLVTVGAFTYQVPLNPTAQEILNKYPLPNTAGTSTGANNLNAVYKQPYDSNQYSIRIDHRISDKDSLFGRASYINNNQNHTDSVAAIEDLSFSSGQFNNPRNFTVSETHIFSPTLLNSFNFTLNRQIEAVLYTNQSATQTTFSDGSLSNWGPDTFITKYVETNFHPQDNVTWTKGRHTLNMGGMFRRGRDNGFGVTNQGPNGVYAFGAGTPLAQTIVSTDGKSSSARRKWKPERSHQHDGGRVAILRPLYNYSRFRRAGWHALVGPADLAHGRLDSRRHEADFQTHGEPGPPLRVSFRAIRSRQSLR